MSQLAAADSWSRRPRSWSTCRRGPRTTRTSCCRSTTSSSGRRTNGPLPAGGWLLLRTGWDERSADAARFLNADETGPHTPGRVRGVRAVARRGDRRSSASAWRRSAPTRAPRTASSPPFPCHHYFLGAGKMGLTQLQNLASLPPTGAVLVVSPLPIVGGSGSPAAGVRAGRDGDARTARTTGACRRTCTRTNIGRWRDLHAQVGRCELGAAQAFGVVGSGNFASPTRRRRRCRSWPPGTSAARRSWPTRTPG